MLTICGINLHGFVLIYIQCHCFKWEGGESVSSDYTFLDALSPVLLNLQQPLIYARCMKGIVDSCNINISGCYENNKTLVHQCQLPTNFKPSVKVGSKVY